MIGGNKHRGVTLIEMVVVLAVFSTAILVAVDVYFTAIRAERFAGVGASLQRDARSVLETMVRDIRLGRVDYEYYSDPIFDGVGDDDSISLDTATDILAVRDADNNQVFYRKEGTNIVACVNSIENPKYCDANGWVVVNPDEIDVTRLAFIISPSSDPAWVPTAKTDCLNQNNFKDIGVCSCDLNQDCHADQSCVDTGVPNEKICAPPDQQPIVTILFAMKGTDKDATESTLTIQTTAASRTLVR